MINPVAEKVIRIYTILFFLSSFCDSAALAHYNKTRSINSIINPEKFANFAPINKIVIMKIKLLLAVLMMSTAIFAQGVKKDITLDDIWKNNTFKAETVSGIESMKDGLHYTTYKDGAILRYEYKTGKVVDTILAESSMKDSLNIGDYQFNADETKIIIKTKVVPIYRRSYTANYFIYDRASKVVTPVSDKGKQQYASLSPNGNKVAFARDNNLFIKDLNNGNEKQITLDGKLNEIINGSCDWVYEEEFEFAPAFFW